VSLLPFHTCRFHVFLPLLRCVVPFWYLVTFWQPSCRLPLWKPPPSRSSLCLGILSVFLDIDLLQSPHSVSSLLQSSFLPSPPRYFKISSSVSRSIVTLFCPSISLCYWHYCSPPTNSECCRSSPLCVCLRSPEMFSFSSQFVGEGIVFCGHTAYALQLSPPPHLYSSCAHPSFVLVSC